MTPSTSAVYQDAATVEFLDGTALGELRIRRCDSCSRLHPPQTQTCSDCDSEQLSWIPAAGTGTVVTWSVDPGTPDDGSSRTVVAIVELTEGPWLHSRLDGVEPDAISAGMPVAVAFEQPGGGETVPVFRPVVAEVRK